MKIPFSADEMKDWAAAPPSLELIDRIVTPYYYNREAFDCSWMPRTLTHINYLGKDRKVFSMTPSSYSTLPSGLRKINLDISNVWVSSDVEYTEVLPRHLTDLTVDYWGMLITVNDLRLLPSTLRSLRISIFTMYWYDIKSEVLASSSPIWPSSLNLLELGAFPPSYVSILPKSLSSLKLTFDQSQAFERDPKDGEMFILQSSDFPPALTHLDLTFQFSKTDRRIRFDGLLPTGLTSLSLNSHKDGHVELHSQSLKVSLPPSLTSLAARFFRPKYASYFDFSRYPLLKSLKYLRSSMNLASMVLLPIGLETLELHELDAGPLLSPLGLPSSLPPTLTRLGIKGWRWNRTHEYAQFLRDSLPHLKCLQCLKLPKLPLPSDILRYLPNSLKELHIDLLTLDLEDLQFLPSRLQSGRFVLPMTYTALDEVRALLPRACRQSSFAKLNAWSGSRQ